MTERIADVGGFTLVELDPREPFLRIERDPGAAQAGAGVVEPTLTRTPAGTTR